MQDSRASRTGPARGGRTPALARLAARLGWDDPARTPMGSSWRVWAARAILVGFAFVLATLAAVATKILIVEGGAPHAERAPSFPPPDDDEPLPVKDEWESSEGVALVTSDPITTPGAHPSEVCLPITDVEAARCYARLVPMPPRSERALRNLIIAERLLVNWDATSHLAALYWKRYPRSPFLSGIRPLVYGPATEVHPMIPPGLTPTTWPDRLSGVAGQEVHDVADRTTRAIRVHYTPAR